MIHLSCGFILPLVHHLVEKRLNCFIPAMPPDVSPAYDDLRLVLFLSPQGVVAKPRFHFARYAYGYLAQLTAELHCIQLAVCPDKVAYECLISRMRPLMSPGLLARGRRSEIERELNFPTVEESPQRSKHRCGPATNVRLSSDQILVITSIVVGPIVITLTDDGRPPRERLETVPAVEMTVPFRVCSM